MAIDDDNDVLLEKENILFESRLKCSEFATNICHLNLIGRQLEDISFIPSNFPNLETLKLAGNRIRIIPRSLGKLKMLKILELGSDCFGGNYIVNIPVELGCCKRLKVLDVTHNQLTCLPTNALSHCPLEELLVSYNHLTSLPSGISELNNLKSLKVSHNKISLIPDDLTDLKSLEMVDLSHNQLSCISYSVLCFLSRRSFLITGNPFSNWKYSSSENGKFNLHDIPSLLELSTRKLIELDKDNLKCLPDVLMERYVCRKPQCCSWCCRIGFDHFLEEIAFDFEFGLSDLPCSYKLCSQLCLKRCRKLRQAASCKNLEW